MNFYYDTEFLEGTQKKRFIGLKYGKTKPTIDLISIGIVSELGDEYYAVSKDFNLKEAWNRYDLLVNKLYPMGGEYTKVYWIRENVLKPIHKELRIKELKETYNTVEGYENYQTNNDTYKELKRLLKKYGKTNSQIADEIKFFIADSNNNGELNPADYISQIAKGNEKLFFNGTNLYGYYSAYDHVVFCWLFGKMINLPSGFPMYTIDLKQILDEKQRQRFGVETKNDRLIHDIKRLPKYPKQENEHNALDDARWNKKLHEFLNKL